MKKPISNIDRSSIPRISEAELLVMQVLWARCSATANTVVNELGPRTKWKPKTIQTLLRRLVDKKAAGFGKQGREYVFHPLVAKGDYVRQAGRSFLDRFFGGQFTPFFASFLETEKLSARDIAELRRLLDNQKP